MFFASMSNQTRKSLSFVKAKQTLHVNYIQVLSVRVVTCCFHMEIYFSKFSLITSKYLKGIDSGQAMKGYKSIVKF